jgi:nicotinamide phosphoribosyltransferase
MSSITSPSPIAPLLTADGYKSSHFKIWPRGTSRVLINWTNRNSKYLGDVTHAVVFGLQAWVQSYLVEMWAPFFATDVEDVVREYDELLAMYFGPDNVIGTDHIRQLHTLGYLPLHIRGLREGTLAPIGIATVTIENTHPDFYWLPNYVETALSAGTWHPATVATIALQYRELMEGWALRTDPDGLPGVDYQAHDFSFRGQQSIDGAAAAGAGHLLSFLGTDTMLSFDWIRRYYAGDNGQLGASVPATEHSVMTVRGPQGELETFNTILDTFPTGIVSAVSDGFDLFKVITETLPQLHERIMSRAGKLVIRPDSGDPVDILCGDIDVRDKYVDNGDCDAAWNAAERGANLSHFDHEKSRGRLTSENIGVVELLWDQFGGATNEQGYKVLDPHIGAIYGDSITLDRANRIFERLEAKGFASTNVVLGIGSYTYVMVTRDSLGSAVKSTWAEVDGEPVDIQKDPKTAGAFSKKSAKGRIAVVHDADGELIQLEQASPIDERDSLLTSVWVDGEFTRYDSFSQVRQTLRAERAALAERRAV